MEKKNLKVDSEAGGKRLDVYLAEIFKDRFSRSQVKRFIDEERVLVDNKVRKAHYNLGGTEDIEISIPDTKEPDIASEDMRLDIIYEDQDILILNKPVGMVVHPAAGHYSHTLVNGLLYHTKGRLSYMDSSTRPGIVHRLDKGVSGLMVVAKTDIAHRKLVDDFKNRQIKRIYIAFVKGMVKRDFGETALPIARSASDRKKMAVSFSSSREAITRFKVLKRYPAYTKLQLTLGTGRTHQIRVHTSYIKHPIIGDDKYGGPQFKRIALYAAELMLRHPISEKQLHFKIDIPDELKSLDEGRESFV